MHNPEIELAWKFINSTHRNVFLTGKAGTGKTTFLHNLKKDSLKRMIVVAPTGVAAINAKGVTIHSFFQLPFGPIIPDSSSLFQNSFSKKFSSTKIKLIKSLDLLVIDEISMVRADMLDGIDSVLKRHRDRNRVFGGVQVLMIGDLQQLSPIVKDNEWKLLKTYYSTGFFFSSKAFHQCHPLTIELKHIYRQDNPEFIKILNEVRNNILSKQSAEILNKRYLPNFSVHSNHDYITLTTHNYKADNINDSQLAIINSKSLNYDARIEGKFPEFSYPTHENLKLKVGAQVMFVKNDNSIEKRYFNGKIGTIIELSKNEVVVRCPTDDDDIHVTPELWENINYSIHKESNEIVENKIGSFMQMPLRLAWAITIHKSQGLTFENVIIDAEEAFAHGQTYVALSRCRTLDGIVLKSPVTNKSIINNQNVVLFTKESELNQPNEDVLKTSRIAYQLQLIEELFDYYEFMFPIKRLIDIYYKNQTSIEGNFLTPLNQLKDNGIAELLKVASSFKTQLQKMSVVLEPEQNKELQQRFIKAVAYFKTHTLKFIQKPLDELTFSTDNKTIKKDISQHLETLEKLLEVKTSCLNGLTIGFSTIKYLELKTNAIFQEREKETKPKGKKEYSTKTGHPVLFERLRELRSQLAGEYDVAHYQIFTQKALFEMCEVLPTNSSQLGKIRDIGKSRLKKYGNDILEVINDYYHENDIPFKSKKVVSLPAKKEQKESTKAISLRLFKNGMSILDIAKERGFTSQTIEGHLSSFIPSGETDILDLISEEKYIELKEIMESISYDSLTDLKRKTNDKYTYGEMRIVENSMKSKP